MFDIGIGEILLIAVAGLLIFGPEKLPKAAADAARMLKQVRGMAQNARNDLVDSAGIDLNETVETVRSLSDLHPRNLAKGILDDPGPSSNGEPRKTGGSTPNGAAKGPASGPGSTPLFDPDAT